MNVPPLDVELAAASATAYADPATWERGDCHAVLASTAGTHIIAFRGTADVMAWLIDFEAIPKLHPQLGFCHAGFLDDVMGIADQILADLPPGPYVVTGHSKGGAEALIFAAIATLRGRPPIAVVTFGAPRAAFAKLGDVLDMLPVRQYRHANDPVPSYPLADAGWRHWHEPIVSLIEIIEPGASLVTGYGSAVVDLVRHVPDHFIAGYLHALAA